MLNLTVGDFKPDACGLVARAGSPFESVGPPEGGRGPGTACGRGIGGRIWIGPRSGLGVAG